eukprot:1327978-Amorphochlora_amoeboformis.AAC.1
MMVDPAWVLAGVTGAVAVRRLVFRAQQTSPNTVHKIFPEVLGGFDIPAGCDRCLHARERKGE